MVSGVLAGFSKQEAEWCLGTLKYKQEDIMFEELLYDIYLNHASKVRPLH